MTPLDLPAPGLDPEFALGTLRDLRVPESHRGPAAADWLAHRVSRNRGDLLAHTQRVGLHADLADAEGLCAAFRDLFIALGPAGAGLKERLVSQASGVLAPECGERLRGSLDPARADFGPCRGHGASVLDDAVMGSRTLVKRVSEADGGTDPVAAAESELELGNLAGARELLEAALADPLARDRALGLLATIYRSTGDRAGLHRVEERFPAAVARVPAWSAARDALEHG